MCSRKDARRLHIIGYVTTAEFQEMLGLYNTDDLELHIGYEWLKESWVRTLLHAAYVGMFFEYVDSYGLRPRI
jgi:hypothetical protein